MVTSGFFRGEAFDPDKDIPDLDGQVYIVTGASTGIGYGIVVHLLQHNASRIIILNNSEEHAREAMADLKQYGDTSRVIWQQCDLRNLQQTDHVAKKLRKEEQRIDGLILNAGIGVNKFALTDPDNLDSHFEVNMLSQLHLALILLPTLKATAETTNQPSRLILMSSEMHRFSPSSTEFASVEEINTNVGATELYGRSKLAQILIMRELARRLDGGELGFAQSPSHRLVIVNATHPGGVKTPQQDQMPAAYGETAGKLITKMVRPLMTDPIKHGCRSALFAATSPEMVEGEGVHGQYIMPDKQISEVSKQGQDDAMAKRLWDLSIGLLREKVGTLDYGYGV